MEVIIQLIGAAIGSLGFSLLFNAGKRTLLPAVVGGTLGWAFYLLFEWLGASVFVAAIAASVFCQIYSEFLARLMKAPTTVFFIPAIVPLVPGGSLYHTMYYAATKDWSKFREYGVSTVQVAFGIAVGASFISALLLLLPQNKQR